MKKQYKHHKWILYFVILLMALSIAAPVLADYLGPNRTVTTTTSVCQAVLYECKEVNGHWKYKRMQDWSCPNAGEACAGYPSNSRPCSDESNVPGWEYCKKEESTQTTTVTYAPATINGSLQNCTVQNGWCVSPPNLSLSANEPLAGYSILLIEGTLNGGTFACPNGATSCTVPFNEGENNFNYWALSSWGDSSAMGTSAARVDTVAPSVGLDISGTSGTNGWYVSPLTITATGADATSGVASMLLSIDGGATWQPALTLNEGVYNAAVSVADYAGNVSNSATTLSVDTTTPTINMSVAGTLGKNGWYKSAIQVTAAASDATSGVATFEVSADGAAYQSYAPIAFNDGPHTIQFRAVDAAGNVTETASQAFYVDTLAPTVNLPSSWQLGTNVPYDVIDEGSGLAALRIVIEDEDEKYAKVAWNQEVSGSTYSQDIDWNGQFKDKTVAPPGTYLVWLKASDLAGNERFQLGKVIVPEPNIIWSLLPTEEPAVAAMPPSPPAELSELEAAPSVTTPPTVDFGGGTTQPGEATTQSLLLATGSAGATSTTTTSGILWGVAAVAASAAATAYALDATRKRKEAEAAQAAQVKAEVARSKAERAEKKQKQQENWDKQQTLAQAILAYQQQQQQKKEQQAASNERMAEKMTKFEKQEETAWVAAQAAIKAKQEDKKKAQAAAKTAEQLQATAGYFNSEKQAKPTVVTPAKEKPWWEKGIDWVDKHQVAVSIGIGIAVGLGALAIIATGGLAAPLVIGGAALLAGGITASGTMALNAHYDRPLNQNLIRNVGIAVTSTVVTSVAPTFVTGGQQVIALAATNASMMASAVGIPWLGSAIAFAAPAVGAGWSLWALGSLGAIGYGVAASADPTLSKTEREDGAVVGTLGAQSLDAATNVYEAANLANALSPFKQITTEYGTDAANALAQWDSKTLKNGGAEVALRSGSDADAVDATLDLVKLSDFNSPEAEVLITKIGENSITGDGDTFYIGKAVDGYDGGYAGAARADDNGMFYYTNPQVYKILKANIKDPAVLDDILIRINKSAVQTPIADNMNFKYSLDGTDAPIEIKALQALQDGDIKEVVNLLGKVPARIQEVQTLMNAGYTFDVNPVDNAIPIQQP